MQCLLEYAKNFFFAHDQELIAVQLDLGAGVFTKEDLIASFNIKWEYLALIVGLALTNRDHFALLWLFLSGIRDDDTATDALAFFYTTNQDAIVQGCECLRHCLRLLITEFCRDNSSARDGTRLIWG